MTIIEALKKVQNDLSEISVPAKYAMTVTRPICEAMDLIGLVVDAMEKSDEKREQEEKEPEETDEGR